MHSDPKQVDILMQGVLVWNTWRELNPAVRIKLNEINLEGAELEGINLNNALCIGINFSEANLRNAMLQNVNLSGAHLYRTDLSNANMEQATCIRTNFAEANLYKTYLRSAKLPNAYFRATNLSMADLSSTDLSGCRFEKTDITNAILTDADLQHASLIGANCAGADFSRARVYGMSVWDVKLKDAKQDSLLITPSDQSAITVDNMEVAQFIYLILNNQKLRDVIDTITSKVVLILGRFTPERKRILDAIHQILKLNNYLPVLFDFEKPTSRDLTETISTLAHISRFVIADITSARSIPQELMAIVPNLPSVPVVPLIDSSTDQQYDMFEHIERYPTVLKPVDYKNSELFLANIQDRIILPAEEKVKELLRRYS